MSKKIQNSSDVKDVKLGKIIGLTILKTLGLIIFCMGFLVVSLSVVAPKLMLRAFDSVNLSKASFLVQKRMYERDNSNENLYNVIQRAIEQQNYNDQAKYIEAMIKVEDYIEFCEVVDASTKKTLGPRYSIYADSYDTYLRRHLVVALYETDREMEAKMMAIDSVYGSLDELYMYVGLVVNDDDLTETQKTSEITTLYSRYSIVSAIDTKLLELDESLSLSESEYDSIIILEQKVKLAEIQEALGKYAGNEALEESARENKEGWSNEIKVLIEAL